LPEHGKPTFIDKLVQGVIQQGLGGVRKSVERFVKRVIRVVALALAGVVVAVMGIAFASFGIVKWLSNLMPGWLAWLIVGMILFLLGIALTLMAMVTSRN
jgi:hypothetical protein